MNIRIIILMVVLAIPVSVFARGPAVGSTSSWGIVYSPCAWCGETNDLEVHHVYPRHLYPAMERDTNYMVCLCRTNGMGCHWWHGHGGTSWTNEVTNLFEIIREHNRGNLMRTTSSNMTDVITDAINAVGGPDADWRVQAGVVALLVVIGTGALIVKKIKDKKNNKEK
jgi:type IV secretory pathway VirB2 component (pilin)